MDSNNEKVKKELGKKLRKFFRRKRREYFWLGYSENSNKQLATRLPLTDYYHWVKSLSSDELYQFKLIFQALDMEEELMAITDKQMWFDRCCSDLRLFDSFSDEQLAEIINTTANCNSIYVLSNLFSASHQTSERQRRMLCVLQKDALARWLNHLNDWSEVNVLLIKYYQVEKNEEEAHSDRERASKIFQKFASLPGNSLAEIFVRTEHFVAKRILQEVKKLERDEIAIYEEINEVHLCGVLIRTDFDLLDNADSDVYTWVYEHIAEEDEEDFFCYLVDERISDIDLFDERICAGIFSCLADSLKEDFLKKVFIRNNHETFMQFYEELSKEEKEEMFEILSKAEEGREIIKCIIASKEEEGLTFLEALVKEKYVTKK